MNLCVVYIIKVNLYYNFEISQLNFQFKISLCNLENSSCDNRDLINCNNILPSNFE